MSGNGKKDLTNQNQNKNKSVKDVLRLSKASNKAPQRSSSSPKMIDSKITGNFGKRK